ncbi:MAG: hypothetical protein JO327_06065 [Nitrososphaeraceae archaeon]|nr:hypothetical protein [Nitrososphaeraceae archaeon]
MHFAGMRILGSSGHSHSHGYTKLLYSYNVSIPVNANSSELRVKVLPPKIVMNYAGIEY